MPEGPGIDDDGSGSATQIEVALQMAKLGIKPANQVRFIWFSREEQGLFGSTFYADQLTKSQRSDVSAMLDFDMLASPNYALQIYDGDGVRRRRPERLGHRGERVPGVLRRGIPAGGIAAGAEVLACDSYPVHGHPDNINNTALDINLRRRRPRRS